MAQFSAPSLDQLQHSDQPAWLWDGMRGRIVWANLAGITLFGGETLFDLIDRPFDTSDTDIAEIAELTRSMQHGEIRKSRFSFAAAVDDDLSLSCSCSQHVLADGRDGLLIVAESVEKAGNQRDSRLMTDVLDSMPLAIVVADRNGSISYRNAAADELLPRARRDTAGKILGSTEDAEKLIKITFETGTTSKLRRIATVFGERDFRITSRLLEDSETSSEQHVLMMLDDVTDRRALERSLSQPPKPELKEDEAPQVHTPEVAAAADESETDEPDETVLPPHDDTSAANEESVADAQDLPEPETKRDEAPKHDDAPELSLPAVPRLVSKTLDKLDEAILLHRGGRLYFANRACLALLGYEDVAELAGRKDLIGELNLPAGNEAQIDTRDASGASIGLAMRTGKFPWHDGPLVQSTIKKVEPIAFAKQTRAAESPLEDLEPELEHDAEQEQTSADVERPAFDTILPTTEEITPVPTETAAPITDPELQAILDTATDGIVTLDEKGNVLSFSAGAEALFGYRSAEVIGKPFSNLLAGESRSVLQDYLAALSGGGIASVFNDGRDVTGVVSQGGGISLFMTITRLSGTRQAKYCAVLRDVTQWKKTEAQLRRDKEEAERANAQKSEFLAQISHELRTPLNAILGFSDVMRSERFGEIKNEKYLGYANDIHKSGSHLLSLINDLLDLSKVEAGKLELNFTSVDLRSVVEECFVLMHDQATAARVVVRKSMPADLPNVVADFRSIKQILLNLLSNAIKFTDPGGQVIVSALVTAGGELKLKIKDTGIGMNQDDLQTALKPFRRLDEPGRDEQQGTGLGLPLTRALTEANRARFDISSEKKRGTMIEITFPTTRVLAD